MLTLRTTSLPFLLTLFTISCMNSPATQGQNQDPELTEVWEPQPEQVEPMDIFKDPPADATVLFDGTSFDHWESANGSDVEWILEDGAMTVKAGTGAIRTRDSFGDVHLYIEWRAPEVIEGEGQGRGNSGIFLQDRYELQVLDNWNNPTYANGMAGSIYKQHIPLANPAKRPGEWQTYEIFFKAPIFNDQQELEEPARMTVLLNGILVQNNVEIFGTTVFRGRPSYEYHQKDKIQLQDHSNPVSFRNIWIRELNEEIIQADGISPQ